MSRKLTALRVAALAVFAAHRLIAHADTEPLQLLGRTPIADYDGDFDHLAADVKGNRLFLAGEDKGTLEVFDLRNGAHLKTVSGMGAPHALHYSAKNDRLIVTNSGEAMSKILDGKTYRLVATIQLAPGADAMGYDASANRAWIVAGGKNAEPKLPRTILSEVDVSSGRKVGEVSFDTDFTEGIAAEQKGNRLFVNLAGASTVAVLDKRTRRQIASWPIAEGQNNSAIALDEDNKRLFVVTRKPFKVVVLNTDTGRSIASFDAPQRSNDMFFDKGNHRLYVTGDDYVATFQQRDADHYGELSRVKSDKGAKTALLVPDLGLLYVAVAGSKTTPAGLLRYRIEPTTAH